jgi:TolB protein
LDRSPICILHLADGRISPLAPGRAPAWSPDGTEIAYTGVAKDDPGLHVMRVDGTGDRRLTPAGEWADSPSWSPDASHIVYVASQGEPGSTDEKGGGIYTIGADGSDERVIRPETKLAYCDFAPKWSPDGTQILLSEQPPDVPASSDCNVHAMRSDGSGDRELTPGWNPNGGNIPGIRGSWSQDGRQIVVAGAPPNAPEGIWTMTAVGQSVRHVCDNAFSPTW